MLDRRQFMVTGAAAGLLHSSAWAWSPGADRLSIRKNVSDYLGPLVQRNDYSGFVILERGGLTLVSEGFGLANDAESVPHNADTHYATASVGKMFTRAAVLALEKAGKLDRRNPIARFLPAFPGGRTITIEHLLDHTSGIARDLPVDTDLKRSRTLEQLAAMIAEMPIEAEPGKSAAYSNNGYRLLARIIELAGGGDFDSIVRETVFEPRKMRDTLPNLSSIRIPRRTQGYRPGTGWNSKVPAAAFDMTNFRGAGSFMVTPKDLMRFIKTLPLEPGDLDAAATKDAEGKPKPRALGHDGFGDGYANLAYAYPDEQAYMVSLSNMQTGVFTPMHADLRRLLFGEAVAAPEVPSSSAGAAVTDWDRYVGDYDLRPGNPLRIRRQGDVLTVNGGDGAHPLVPLGGDRFFMRLRYATMSFDERQDGKAQLLRWSEGGGAFPLKRIA